MLASDQRLMLDPADNARPSSAPLSAEDADRLADGFTAFWEDPPAPAVAEPAPTPHPGAVTAPMPAVVPAPAPPTPTPTPTPKPKVGKQTLVGIAPITIERPSEKPPEKPAPSDPHPSAPILSSPEVPGYAIAYTPKDPPSTPAVVIAPEAQSSPDNEAPADRRRFSQTVPSIRSAPNASLAPLPPLPPALDDFDPYAPKNGKGKIIGLALGGALVLLVSVLGIRALGGGTSDSGLPLPAAVPVANVVHATTVAAVTPTSAPTESPAPASAPASASAPSGTAERAATTAARTASERAPTKAKTKGGIGITKEGGVVATRPPTRAPTPEPSPPPASKPASKGVIVRDAPF